MCVFCSVANCACTLLSNINPKKMQQSLHGVYWSFNKQECCSHCFRYKCENQRKKYSDSCVSQSHSSGSCNTFRSAVKSVDLYVPMLMGKSLLPTSHFSHSFFVFVISSNPLRCLENCVFVYAQAEQTNEHTMFSKKPCNPNGFAANVFIANFSIRICTVRSSYIVFTSKLFGFDSKLYDAHCKQWHHFVVIVYISKVIWMCSNTSQHHGMQQKLFE